MSLVQKCELADYDTGTHVCAQPYWDTESTVIPSLSIADAKELGMAIALLWAGAFAWRYIRKAFTEIAR